MKILLYIIGIIILLFIAFSLYWRMTHRRQAAPAVNLTVTSTAFADGGDIPVKYTGRGENVSPQLKLEGIASNAVSIAVVMDDIDFPFGVLNHWIIWNVPAAFTEIPEAIPRTDELPSLGGAIQGKSEYGGKHYYRGPLPPFGSHKYLFKVYVLDVLLDLPKDAGIAKLEKAMEGHILQYGTITGKYGN